MPVKHQSDDLFHWKDKKRKRGILTSGWSAKTWYKGVLILEFFNVFHHYKSFALRQNQIFLFLDVDMYPLNAYDLKCNVNPLTPDQIIFCLADTENHKFKA